MKKIQEYIYSYLNKLEVLLKINHSDQEFEETDSKKIEELKNILSEKKNND